MKGRWAALIGVSVGTALLGSPAGAAAGTLDQSQPTFSPGAAPFGSATWRAAQSFTAGLTGRLDQVDVSPQQSIYTCDRGSVVTVAIQSLSGSGAPSDNTLASTTIPAAGITTTYGFGSAARSSPTRRSP